MDNLTHTLTGLMLSRAGLDRVSPRSALIMMIAANAPDLDVISMLFGTETYLKYHRWATHAFFFLPAVALIPVLIARLVHRKPIPYFRAWLISLVGVLSHLLLDWTNLYGIRLLLPFSSEWFHLDITSVVDMWIWTILLLATLGPMLARLVSSEIGARPGKGRGWAVFALLFLFCYDMGRFFLHERAINVQAARIYGGAPPRHVAAYPSAFNPLRWRGLVETEASYLIHPINLLLEFDPSAATTFYKPDPNAAINVARQTEPFQLLFDFTPYPLLRVLPMSDPDPGTRVEVIDLRFGQPPNLSFYSVAILDSSNRVQRSWFSF